MRTLNLKDYGTVKSILDTYFDHIVEINELATKIRIGYPDVSMYNINDCKSITSLVLTPFRGYEAYNKRMNACCVEHYGNEPDIFTLFENIVYNLPDSDNAVELGEKIEKIFNYLVDNFDASVIYRECVATNYQYKYISKKSLLRCAALARESSKSTVNSPSRIPDHLTFKTADELIEFISTPIDTINKFIVIDSEKDAKTSVLIKSIVNNEINTADIFKAYRDEFVSWVKVEDLPTRTDKNKFPLIHYTNFSQFFIYAFRNLMNSGDINSVIDTYTDSIDGQDDKTLIDHVNDQIALLKNYRYFITAMFHEVVVSEDLAKYILPVEFILYVLSVKPKKNCAAYQVHELFRALYLKADYVSERINDCYVHFIDHDQVDERDIWFTSCLQMLMGFNNGSVEIVSPIYYMENIYRSSLYNSLSYTRFIRGMVETVNGIQQYIDKEPVNVDINTSDDELIDIVDSYIKYINDKLNEESSSEKVSEDDKDMTEYYKNKIEVLEDIKDSINYASSLFDDNVKAFDKLDKNCKAITEADNFIRADYSDISYNGLEDSDKLPIWPIRVILEQSSDEQQVDSEKVSEAQRNLRDLKPGDIFKKYEMTSKSPCR